MKLRSNGFKALGPSLGLALGLLFAASADAGACRGNACRDTWFDKDKDGCLMVRNRGQLTIQVSIMSTHGTQYLRLYSGDYEKVYYIGRKCVMAVDYVRSESKFEGEPRF
jgi:hypothetical protein